MIISLRIGDEEGQFLKDYAKGQHTTVSEVLREIITNSLETSYNNYVIREEMIEEASKYVFENR